VYHIVFNIALSYAVSILFINFHNITIITLFTAFSDPENHRWSCTEKEKQKKACLNGETCLASIIGDYRIISCQ